MMVMRSSGTGDSWGVKQPGSLHANDGESVDARSDNSICDGSEARRGAPLPSITPPGVNFSVVRCIAFLITFAIFACFFGSWEFITQLASSLPVLRVDVSCSFFEILNGIFLQTVSVEVKCMCGCKCDGKGWKCAPDFTAKNEAVIF